MKYKFIKEQYIEEIKSVAYMIKHIKSGARILFLKNNDNNKTFTIGFRTPPTNDTGVPHILEHSTLCGSSKYPVKDPFVELLKSSLNTFLNAMTFPDKTIYPVASCNLKDFKNLMDVYMDAVFNPNVYKYEEIFKQEGWHYELDSVDSDITYNGIVYNEMKGVFSSPEQVIMRECFHTLYPNTPYGVESGGDPDYIPELSYEEFKNFHKRFYHPSNSYIILYGDIDISERLEYLDKEYLSKYDKIKPDSSIPYQKGFKKPVESSIYYPIGKDESKENKTYYAFNASISNYKDIKLAKAFEILTYVLLDAPGAILRQALIDNKLGEDVIDFYDSGLLQPVLSIIIKGSNEGLLDKFKNILTTTLQKIVKDGIDKKTIKAAINSFEFKLRECDFGQTPKGLEFTISAFDTWLYDDKDAFSKLMYYDIYKELKNDVETSYFEDLIDKYLLHNNHVSYITLSPSSTLAKEKEDKLKEKLKAYKETLTKEQLEQLVKDTKALKEYQQTPSTKEELATVPQLTRSDIEDVTEQLYNKEERINELLTIKHEIETNNISYIKFFFNTINVDKDLIPYIGILEAILTKIDTTTYKYQDLFNEVSIRTGGISPKFTSYSMPNNNVLPMFSINAKAFDENIKDVFELVNDIVINSIYTNEKRIYELLLETKSNMQMMMTGRGHSTSVDRALSYIMASAKYKDLVNGISWYKFLEQLCDNYDINVVSSNLINLSKQLFRKENLIISYTGKSDEYKNYVSMFASTLFEETYDFNKFEFTQDKLNEGFKTSSQVQYVARVGNFADKYEYTGAFNVFGMALRYDYLWTKVRVVGGAYGCMSGVKMDGTMYFTSYRDPNLEATMEVYDNIVNYLEQLSLTEEELTKYIIGAIGMMDTPLTPREKGERSFNCYIRGVTYDMLVKERHEVLSVTMEDIKNLLPIIKYVLSQNSLCTIGNEKKIEESNLFKNKLNLVK